MSNIVRSERTVRERVYGTVTLLLGPPFWALIIIAARAGLADQRTSSITKLYIAYGVIIAVAVWIAAAAYRATAFGNMILLGPNQLPALHEMVLEGSRELGLSPPPKAFLFNSNGLLNAFARRLLGGRYVFLTSALVEVETDEQIRFVIGHELGHHAAGHLSAWRNLLRLPTYLIPFLQPAYSRSREYTCDRIGARVMKETAPSQSALMMLGCGCARVNRLLSCEAFMTQEQQVPPIFGFLTEIVRSHPRLTRRMAALDRMGLNAADRSRAYTTAA